MNILHVVSIYFSLPYFIGDQFKFFKSKGHNMYVVCSKSDYLFDYAQQQGFNYLETPIKRSISLLDDYKSVLKILRYIKEMQIDVVVGHSPKGALLAMIAGSLAHVPARIYLCHGLVYETSHGLKRFILKTVERVTSLLATQIVCVSPSVLQRTIKEHIAPRSKQIILHHGTCNGIDTINKFNPDNIDKKKLAVLKKTLGITNDDFVIGYSGRLVRDKGIIPLVQAFDLLDKSANYKLLLVGMFEERDSLPISIQARIKNDPRIIYTGLINLDMEYYYSLMNIYVLASYREGFPTGVLEAQAMDVPVLTTRVTGCCDSIVEGKTGLFITHDAEDIKNKVELICAKKNIHLKEGRKWVVEHFDSRLIWKEIEKLYEGILKN